MPHGAAIHIACGAATSAESGSGVTLDDKRWVRPCAGKNQPSFARRRTLCATRRPETTRATCACHRSCAMGCCARMIPPGAGGRVGSRASLVIVWRSVTTASAQQGMFRACRHSAEQHVLTSCPAKSDMGTKKVAGARSDVLRAMGGPDPCTTGGLDARATITEPRARPGLDGVTCSTSSGRVSPAATPGRERSAALRSPPRLLLHDPPRRRRSLRHLPRRPSGNDASTRFSAAWAQFHDPIRAGNDHRMMLW
ncbi:MAG: hypothetical protein JW940_07600 [Polyangiaceae bacterium]|nr:hypothetical protein [Polyangiaceae bacterium]